MLTSEGFDFHGRVVDLCPLLAAGEQPTSHAEFRRRRQRPHAQAQQCPSSRIVLMS
jgi:hypothetical protein